MGKGCLHFFSAVLDRILFILAGNDNIHESLDEFEIWLDLTTGFHGNRYCRFGNIREDLIFANIREFVASRIQSSR